MSMGVECMNLEVLCVTLEVLNYLVCYDSDCTIQLVNYLKTVNQLKIPVLLSFYKHYKLLNVCIFISREVFS